MKKTLILSVIAIMMMSPLSMFANDFDGFFRGVGDDVYTNRDVDTQGITIEGMHSESPVEAPLGSGLLVMVAAGIGYAAMRRFRKVKSNSLIAMLIAVVLLFGMTQCRKKVVEIAEPGTVFMTVTAGGGDRVVFNPSILGFNWNITGNEYVVVSGNYSGYLGELTALSCGGCAVTQRKEFSGMITAPNDKDTELYFFYLGNGSHSQEPGTESVVIDFSNQVDEDVSTVTDYLIATEHISADEVVIENEQCHVRIDLRVKTAIAFFRLSGFTGTSNQNETVYLHGTDVYTSAEINFKTGEVIGKDRGYINVGTNNANGVYVSLIDSGTTTAATLQFDSNSKSGSIVFPDGIKENVFYSDELNSEFTPLSIEAAMSLPDDVLPGLFSVSPTKKVRFSKGNLKFSRASLNDDWSTGTWSFMENQYDEVEIDDQEVGGNYSDFPTVSLFGWGTSGEVDVDYNYKEIMFKPYSTRYQYDIIGGSVVIYDDGEYGPSGEHPLSVANHSDWGYCMGGESSQWRTLTFDEWKWLLGAQNGKSYVQPDPASNECRTSSPIGEIQNARYTLARIDNQYIGLVIFPDDYVHPGPDLKYVNYWFKTGTTGAVPQYPDFSGKWDELTHSEWEAMEAAGAVFLPAAGCRIGDWMIEVNFTGNYWSSSCAGEKGAYSLQFSNNVMKLYGPTRCGGFSVRLVTDGD